MYLVGPHRPPQVDCQPDNILLAISQASLINYNRVVIIVGKRSERDQLV